LERGGVEDVDSWTVTRDILPHITTDDNDLPVPDVTGMPRASWRLRLTCHIYLNPRKRGDSQNPHIGVLYLRAVGNKILPSVEIDVE
jgi:hypothetical protein